MRVFKAKGDREGKPACFLPLTPSKFAPLAPRAYFSCISVRVSYWRPPKPTEKVRTGLVRTGMKRDGLAPHPRAMSAAVCAMVGTVCGDTCEEDWW